MVLTGANSLNIVEPCREVLFPSRFLQIMEKKIPLVVGISGASGIQYAYKLVNALSSAEYPFYLIWTKAAKEVLKYETNYSFEEFEKEALGVFEEKDIGSAIASGSHPVKGMVVIPCSSKTLGLIAHGIDLNLIARAAAVQLKERRKLVLVLRETPLSLPIIENMRALALSGATILPASPGFYHEPKTLDDLYSFIVGKVLDQFGIEHDLYKRWKTP